MSAELPTSFEDISIIEEVSLTEFERYVAFIEKYPVHSLASLIEDNSSVFELFGYIGVLENYLTNCQDACVKFWGSGLDIFEE